MIPRRENFECVVKYHHISHISCQEKFENVTINDIDEIIQSQCPQVTSQMNSTGHCTPISRNEKTYWAVILFIGVLLPIFVTMCAYTFLFREVKTVRRAVSSFDRASIMRKSAISSAKGIHLILLELGIFERPPVKYPEGIFVPFQIPFFGFFVRII